MAILLLPEGVELPNEPEKTLLEVCIENKIALDHSCEGMASCGTCRVLIEKSEKPLEPPQGLELEMAQDRRFLPHDRLACQLKANQVFHFKIPNKRDELC